jgi:inositol-1,3,4-trisphosphate 5/6-kinase/inositol-tetrakisphosphate 1-kinase
VVTGDATSIPASVSAAGLKLPLVAKPLVSDGSAKAHEMSLAYDKSCLNQLDPPLMLQEFVNHGKPALPFIVAYSHSVDRTL